MKKLILLFLLLSIFLNACDEVPEEKISEASDILPPTLLIEDLKPITLFQPANGQAYYIDERSSTNLVFTFDSSEPTYSALYIFKVAPISSNGIITNGNEVCLGGVTNMTPTHKWDNSNAQLSTSLDTSTLFQCNLNTPIDVFSTTDKLILDENNFPKNTTVYWAMLGYNAHYQLTHSSNIRKINIK